jgi:2,5-diamino-6-(ribosylamino)-4(3H)-pyrimidinone 5'-phosphate reductase
MLMSVDGKISTGPDDSWDFDRDLSAIPGLAVGLEQYYELERRTDLCSFNTGRVMAKVGWNEPKAAVERLPVTFVIVDNRPHLARAGIENLIRRTERLLIATTDDAHPALDIEDERLEVVPSMSSDQLTELFAWMGSRGIERVTIQSGGAMNAALLERGLIDRLSLVVVPTIVGGAGTPTLSDGKALPETRGLEALPALELVGCEQLADSYLHLQYRVQ